MVFDRPPIILNESKQVRKAGFEFELAGLELDEIAQIIVDLYGGEVVVINRFEQNVTGTKHGNFKIEFDSRILKEKRYEQFLKEKVGLDLQNLSWKDNIENAVASVSSTLVPLEVILPPIPIDNLEIVEEFREKLFTSKAEGTGASIFNALAFHINPEVPDPSVSTILNYLRAFLLLQYWIFEQMDIDFTRHRLTGYINYFTKEFAAFVLKEDYKPDMDQLINDYRLYNATRNRPLDFYPLFVHIKGRELVSELEDDASLIKGRPTFHFRLPDSLVDEEDWRVAKSWNCWVKIEELAYDEKKMLVMMEEYQKLYASGYIRFKRRWIRKVNELIHA